MLETRLVFGHPNKEESRPRFVFQKLSNARRICEVLSTFRQEIDKPCSLDWKRSALDEAGFERFIPAEKPVACCNLVVLSRFRDHGDDSSIKYRRVVAGDMRLFN